MKKWQSLKAGDIVDIVAPGSGTSSEDLAKACSFLKSWQLIPRVSDGLFSGHPYLSNEDSFRLRDLKRALLAKDSGAVWCLRGGYGSLRLLPELMKIKTPMKNKIFIGYSDITSLHLFLGQQWKWISCHGPLLDGLGVNKYPEAQVQELKSIFLGRQAEVSIDGVTPFNASARKTKKIAGSLFGGNLVVLCSHFGNKCVAPRLTGKILFLEETGERAYRLDRLLQQLSQSGEVQKARAVMLGDFIGGAEASGENYAAKTLQAWADSLKVPVFKNLVVGHGSINRPLFLGTKSVIEKTAKNDTQYRLVNQVGAHK
jgi:muramoyltetrapeptide carboxypeptidase